MFSSGSTIATPKAFTLGPFAESKWNPGAGVQVNNPFTVSHYETPAPDTSASGVKTWDSRETTNLVSAIDTLAAVDMQLVNWSYFSNLVLTKEDYTKYKSFINWKIASVNIDIDTALQFKECVDWHVFLHTHTNVDINKLRDVSLDWNDVLKTQCLAESEIVYNLYRLDTHSQRESRRLWKTLCKYQTLSEQFMARFWDRLDKKLVARYQQMSYKFILRHIDELDIDTIRHCQDLKEPQLASLGLRFA